MVHFRDTIYALSSGALPSGVAVIRISGVDAFKACALLAGRVPPPRMATLQTIRSRNGLRLDQALVLAFPAPASFTGEDCIEFQLHGGRAVVNAVLDALLSFDNVRHAEAGEFSRRAFENGKLDLVEVEGLADLIGAETEMQRRLALEQSSGGRSRLYNDWSVRLTKARALLEAELDFADEEDIPGAVSSIIWRDLTMLLGEIRLHLDHGGAGEIIRDGLKVVIAGAPNAGKSTLMNALAGRDVAIVTALPGTTRDVLQVDLNIEGFAVTLFDTAGLRETSDAIEREGIRRAVSAAAAADLVLHLEEIGTCTAPVIVASGSARVLRVGTKCDRIADDASSARYDVTVSATEGQGLDALRQMIIGDVAYYSSNAAALPGRRRHSDHLRRAAEGLKSALTETDQGLDIRAEHLRLAAQALGRITGRVDVEDLLDVIFSEFCIGK